jgi:hypothetical protein
VRIISRNENPFPDLVEVKAALLVNDELEVSCDLSVELRVHPCEIEEEIGIISLEISEATLSLDISGANILPKTKLGQPVLSPIVRREIQLEETTNLSQNNEMARAFTGSGSVALSILGHKTQGNAEAKREAREKSSSDATFKKSTTEEREFYRVKAVGNDDWKIAEEGGKSLDGVYIDNEPLCKLSPVSGSNRISAETELIVKQRNMKAKLISPKGLGSLLQTNNQKKIAAILIKKSLNSTISGKKFEGVLVFARTQSFNEG